MIIAIYLFFSFDIEKNRSIEIFLPTLLGILDSNRQKTETRLFTIEISRFSVQKEEENKTQFFTMWQGVT